MSEMSPGGLGTREDILGSNWSNSHNRVLCEIADNAIIDE